MDISTSSSIVAPRCVHERDWAATADLDRCGVVIGGNRRHQTLEEQHKTMLDRGATGVTVFYSHDDYRHCAAWWVRLLRGDMPLSRVCLVGTCHRDAFDYPARLKRISSLRARSAMTQLSMPVSAPRGLSARNDEPAKPSAFRSRPRRIRHG